MEDNEKQSRQERGEEEERRIRAGRIGERSGSLALGAARPVSETRIGSNQRMKKSAESAVDGRGKASP